MDKISLLFLNEISERIDKFVAENVDDLSRNSVGLLIDNGDILVNDLKVDPYTFWGGRNKSLRIIIR